jgi:hypothetical protein
MNSRNYSPLVQCHNKDIVTPKKSQHTPALILSTLTITYIYLKWINIVKVEVNQV